MGMPGGYGNYLSEVNFYPSSGYLALINMSGEARTNAAYSVTVEYVKT
jgi:hypothetical protein